MSVDLDIALPDPAELQRFGAIATLSLGVPLDRGPLWTERIGAAHVRIARRGTEVVGGLGILRMGQWFGGRSVPCAGITAVAIAPEHRSRGIASELMRTALEETRREGFALSSLYPATLPVYRAAGYETAGCRFVYRVLLSSLGSGAREPEAAPAGPADHATLRALYDARARSLSGAIDRSPYFWTRILQPVSGEEARAFLVSAEGGAAEGYVVLGYRPNAGGPASVDLEVRDVVAGTAAAARRIVRLLADHRSVLRSATLTAGPGDPLLLHAREERPEVADLKRWMLRVVDVRAALERRGWSPHVRGELALDVRDELLRDNARRWVLEVAGGRAQVREGGSGAVRLDVRGLAALYSGYLTAEELSVAGLCEGRDAELATASALFAGPAPWAADYF